MENLKYGLSSHSVLGDVDDSGFLRPPSAASDLCFNGVKDIGDLTLKARFYGTAIASAVFPDLVKVSGDDAMGFAFQECSDLESAEFPVLTDISGESALDSAFQDCTNLSSVLFPELKDVSGFYAFNGTFRGCSALESVSFPKLEDISGQEAMCNAFSSCSGLTYVSLGSLKKISGERALHEAFCDCTNLAAAVFPALENISGGHAFACCFLRCRGLRFAAFPALRSAGGDTTFFRAFPACDALESVSFPVLQEVGGERAFSHAFPECSVLDNMRFPVLTSVTGSYAFYRAFENCASLQTVRFPVLRLIGGASDSTSGHFREAFADTAVRELYFPELASVYCSGVDPESGTFSGNETVEKIYLPKLTLIAGTSADTQAASNIFRGCKALKEIHFGKANREVIETMPGFASNWGADGAAVFFDLNEDGSVIPEEKKPEPLPEADASSKKPAEEAAAKPAEKQPGVGVQSELSGTDSGGTLMELDVSTDLSFDGVKDISDHVLQNRFSENEEIRSAAFPDLTEINGIEALNGTFSGCSKLGTASFPALKALKAPGALTAAFSNCPELKAAAFPALSEISGFYALNETFSNCESMTSATFPLLSSVRADIALSEAFSGCSRLSRVAFPVLTAISGSYVFNNAFSQCAVKTIAFPHLATLEGECAMAGAFSGCMKLVTASFPELKQIGSVEEGDAGHFAKTFENTDVKELFFPELTAIYCTSDDIERGTFNSNSGIEKIYLPKLSVIASATKTDWGAANIFRGCNAMKEIHFSAENRAAIEATAGYSILWGAGTGNTKVLFDL